MTAIATVPDIRVIPIADLHESPLNTRTHFDAQAITYLTRVSSMLLPNEDRQDREDREEGHTLHTLHEEDPLMPRTNAAFMKLQQPDAVLAALIGPEPRSRPEITKRIWAVIKSTGCQAGRTILGATPQMRAFIGAESIDMMQLAKCVSAHVTKEG
jgi:chromatin remodeling complex protein RSC6